MTEQTWSMFGYWTTIKPKTSKNTGLDKGKHTFHWRRSASFKRNIIWDHIHLTNLNTRLDSAEGVWDRWIRCGLENRNLIENSICKVVWKFNVGYSVNTTVVVQPFIFFLFLKPNHINFLSNFQSELTKPSLYAGSGWQNLARECVYDCIQTFILACLWTMTFLEFTSHCVQTLQWMAIYVSVQSATVFRE